VSGSLASPLRGVRQGTNDPPSVPRMRVHDVTPLGLQSRANLARSRNEAMSKGGGERVDPLALTGADRKASNSGDLGTVPNYVFRSQQVRTAKWPESCARRWTY
jgi:hypothetical protein